MLNKNNKNFIMGVLDFPSDFFFFWFLKENLNKKVEFQTEFKKVFLIQNFFWWSYFLVLKKKRLWVPLMAIPGCTFWVCFNCLKREIIESLARDEFQIEMFE